jgi:5-methylcytosine-specific restriction endonuclease McrA
MTPYVASVSKNNKQRMQIKRWYKLGQRRCPCCGVQLVYQPKCDNSATFEHLVPRSQGGTLHAINGLMICSKCNHTRGNTCWISFVKKNKPPKQEWLIQRYLAAVKYYGRGAGSRPISVSFKRINIYINQVNIAGK